MSWGKFICLILICGLVLFTSGLARAGIDSGSIIWRTSYASLESDSLVIRVGNTVFRGNDSVVVHSDPGSSTYTTLENSWTENGVEMRLYLYFAQQDGIWRVTEMRTYNGQVRGDWLYYAPQKWQASSGNFFTRDQYQITDSTGEAEVIFSGLKVGAFLPRSPLPLSPEGYSLEAVLSGSAIVVSTQPNTGWGVNVILRDQSNQIVTDQSGINYSWAIAQPEIAQVRIDNQCSYGIAPPCPLIHGDVSGLRVGQTSMNVIAGIGSKVIASVSVPIVVIPQEEYSKASSTDDLQRIATELKQTQAEVRQLQQEQTLLRKLVEELFAWLKAFFK